MGQESLIILQQDISIGLGGQKNYRINLEFQMLQ